MKKVVWITGKTYHVKEFAEIIWHDQARNPFCEKIDNKEYMESTRRYYEESFMTRHIDASKIRTDNEEAFVRSLADLGEVSILEEK
tara:strand:- start:96 stop:353 length:258 start_codon:yes stop_codon:yes gene_type:complete